MTYFLKYILNTFGYKIIKIDKNFYNVKHPLEIRYLKKIKFSVVEPPVHKGYGLRFYSLIRDRTYHPFIIALNAENKNESKKRISRYSESVQMTTANHYFGLENSVFSDTSKYFDWFYPWSAQESSFTGKSLKKIYTVENGLFGLNSANFLEDKEFSEAKVDIEFLRLSRLKDKISMNGYKENFNDSINGFILQKNNEWKWFVESGQHRAAVLSNLGHKNIPVHITQIINRSEVEFWPFVKRGKIDRDSALEIFDSLFDNKPPAITETWRSYVDRNITSLN